MRVYFVRHGEVENPEHVRYGCLPGFHLSERGRLHARDAAGALRDVSPRPLRLLTSPLERAVETAEIIGAELQLSPQVDTRLIEAATWRDGLPRRGASLSQMWRHPRATHEPLSHVRTRVLEVLRDLKEPAIVVSHETPIWLALHAVHGSRYLPLWLARRQLAHGSITPLTLCASAVAVGANARSSFGSLCSAGICSR